MTRPNTDARAASSSASPVVSALKRTGALAYARDCAEDEVRLAGECLAGLAASAYRQNLLELTTFAAQRTY